VDLTREFADVVAAVRSAALLEPWGSRTHAELGHPASADSTAVRGPIGIVRHDPHDLTVTVLAGTPVHEIDAALSAHSQFVPLDPRDRMATVGGTLASGLSGVRRLGYGPLRDHVLEIQFVTGYGELVKGGGPTVKNVTGYDLPRLLVGSLGTLGVMVQVTLRCRPMPITAQWWTTSTAPHTALERLFRPAAVLADEQRTYVLLECDPTDAAVSVATLDDAVRLESITMPIGPHRGRISVPPTELSAIGAALRDLDGVTWIAEWGVGTVHVAAVGVEGLAAARACAHVRGGWMLREAGATTLDPFGLALPSDALHRRVKAALDPDNVLSRGRFG
jgi:glycolate oxidase FAD binding subunit